MLVGMIPRNYEIKLHIGRPEELREDTRIKVVAATGLESNQDIDGLVPEEEFGRSGSLRKRRCHGLQPKPNETGNHPDGRHGPRGTHSRISRRLRILWSTAEAQQYRTAR